MTLALLFVLGILVSCAAAIPLLAKRARIHRAIVVAVAFATSALGALATVPGLVLLAGAVVVAATGPSSGTPWTLLCSLVAASALAGIAAGAAFVGWASRPRVGRIALRTATTFVGAIVGTGLAFAAGTLAGAEISTTLLCSLPLIIVATSVVGFVAPR